MTPKPASPREPATPDDGEAPGGAPSREQFRVDLRGIVDVLSHHLYSSQSVFLREVVQNARDALAARREIDPTFTAGAIDIEPARGGAPMTVRDNGVGLTADEMRELLATIGGSSKRHDLEVARAKFLGQFGIGLFSCFLVADTIEVRSRSARTPDAPTIRWHARSDGTYTIDEDVEPLDSPGSELRLRPRQGELEWCSHATVRRLVAGYAELLDVPVRVSGDLLSQHTPPWELSIEEQVQWCRDRLGFEPMGIVALESSLLDVRGLAFVLPYTAVPGHRTGDRIYSRGMLVSASDDQLLPSWAFFCRAVVDAGQLPLTASRESLLETTSLDFVRERMGSRLLSELIMVQGLQPDIYQDIVRLHSAGLTSLAVQGADLRGLLHSTLPLRTTQGGLTLKDMEQRGGEISFVADADTFAALKDVAVHAGALVVDASGPSEADLLRTVDAESSAVSFREIDVRHILELAKPTAYPDPVAAERLAAIGREALADRGADVQVANFMPAERPVIWWPGSPGVSRPTMVLNGENDGIVRLLEAPGRRTPAALQAFYVLGVLLAGQSPDPEDTAVLSSALQMIAGSAQG